MSNPQASTVNRRDDFFPPPERQRRLVSHDMFSIVNKPRWSDMKVVCAGGVELHGHQNIIYTRSDFFDKALSSAMQEGSSKIVEHDDVLPGVALMMLQYLYSDDYASTDGLKMVLNSGQHMTRFELDTRVALLAERLMLDDLRHFAKDRIRKDTYEIPHWRLRDILSTVTAFYDDEGLSRESEITLEASLFLIRGLTSNDTEAFDQLFTSEHRQTLLKYPDFLLDLILAKTAALRSLRQGGACEECGAGEMTCKRCYAETGGRLE